MSTESSRLSKLNDFKELKEIGRGGFGVVYSAKRTNGEKVALKKIDKSVPQERVWNEIRALKTLKHRNIVEFYEDFVIGDETYLVMELCELGSLRSYVRQNGRLQDDAAAHVMRQLISAVTFMHRKGVLHRDLSSGNVLIQSMRNKYLVVKLGDFGLATNLKRGETACTVVGTPGYIAPQVFNQEYDQSADVFSLGGVLYTMLTANDPPRSGKPTLNGLSRNAADLIESMMHTNAARRIKLNLISTADFMRDAVDENRSREISSDRAPLSRDRVWDRPGRTSTDRRSVERRNEDLRMVRASSQPAISRSRRISLSNDIRNTNHPRIPATSKAPEDGIWPLKIARCAGQRVKTPGGRYIVESDTRARFEVAMTGNVISRVLLVEISATRGTQKVSVYRTLSPKALGKEEQDPLIEIQASPISSFYSILDLPQDVRNDYDRLERIVRTAMRSRVPKLIFNRPEQFPQASAQLMENGDLRIKSPNSVMVKKIGTTQVFNYPNGSAVHKQLVEGTTMRKVEQVYEYLKKMEECMAGMGSLKCYPMVFSVNDPQTSPIQSSRVSRMPLSTMTQQQQSCMPKSAPGAYMRTISDYGNENQAPSRKSSTLFKFKLDKSNRIIAICWQDGRQLRQSTSGADTFVFTSSNGAEEIRFNRRRDAVPKAALELMTELLPKLTKV